MVEIKTCECGCGGKTIPSSWWKSRHNQDTIPKGWVRYNKYIKGHSKKNAHRIKAEITLGHPIPKGVEVHHHSIVGDDGCFKRTSQLVVCENHKYHCYLHIRQRAFYGVKVWRCNVNIKQEDAMKKR